MSVCISIIPSQDDGWKKQQKIKKKKSPKTQALVDVPRNRQGNLLFPVARPGKKKAWRVWEKQRESLETHHQQRTLCLWPNPGGLGEKNVQQPLLLLGFIARAVRDENATKQPVCLCIFFSSHLSWGLFLLAIDACYPHPRGVDLPARVMTSGHLTINSACFFLFLPYINSTFFKTNSRFDEKQTTILLLWKSKMKIISYRKVIISWSHVDRWKKLLGSPLLTLLQVSLLINVTTQETFHGNTFFILLF